jgi:hypothetical protein
MCQFFNEQIASTKTPSNFISDLCFWPAVTCNNVVLIKTCCKLQHIYEASIGKYVHIYETSWMSWFSNGWCLLQLQVELA